MATKLWLGAAQDLPLIQTETFANTYTLGDTIEITIGKQTLIATLGTDVALADVASVAAGIINASNAAAAKPTATGDETYNFGGKELPHFPLISATSSGAVLTITGTPGIKIVVTVAVTTFDTGSVASNIVQAATGKKFYSNVDNWSGGTLPAANDIIVYANSSVDCSYDIDTPADNISLVRMNSYKGMIGLDPDDSNNYLPTQILLPVVITTGTQTHIFGEVGSTIPASGRTRIDLGAVAGSTVQVIVHNGAPASNVSGPAIDIVGGFNTQFYVYKGSVGIGLDRSANQLELASLYVGYTDSKENDAVVWLGSNMVWDATNFAEQLGGTIYMGNGNSSAVDMNVRGGTFYQARGSVAGSPAIASIDVWSGARAILLGGSCTGTMVIRGGGQLDVQAPEGYTAAALIRSVGSKINDPTNLLSVTGGVNISPT